MTTPGPKSQKWRVRKSTGQTPKIDLSIPPFNRNSVTPTRWLASAVDKTTERPIEIVTSTFGQSVINSNAVEFRPWRKTIQEEQKDYLEMVEMSSKSVQESVEHSDSSCQTDESLEDESNTSELGRDISEPSSPVEKLVNEKPCRVRVFLKDLFLYLPIAYQIIMCLPQDTIISIDRILNTAVIGGGLHFLAGGFDKNLIDKYLLVLGTTGLCKLRTHPLLYQTAYIGH